MGAFYLEIKMCVVLTISFWTSAYIRDRDAIAQMKKKILDIENQRIQTALLRQTFREVNRTEEVSTAAKTSGQNLIWYYVAYLL